MSKSARYMIMLPGNTVPNALAPEQVLPFARGYACALGELPWLDGQLDTDAPEDTQRIHVLQLAHARGWFSYLFLDQPTGQAPRRVNDRLTPGNVDTVAALVAAGGRLAPGVELAGFQRRSVAKLTRLGLLRTEDDGTVAVTETGRQLAETLP